MQAVNENIHDISIISLYYNLHMLYTIDNNTNNANAFNFIHNHMDTRYNKTKKIKRAMHALQMLNIYVMNLWCDEHVIVYIVWLSTQCDCYMLVTCSIMNDLIEMRNKDQHKQWH